MKWDFKYNCSETCAQDYVDDNIVTFKIMVTITQTQNFLMATSTFFPLEKDSKHAKGTYISKNGSCYTHTNDRPSGQSQECWIWQEQDISHWRQHISVKRIHLFS